jgi:hypothetical protein
LNVENGDTGQPNQTTVLIPPCWNKGWTQGLTRNDITGRAIFARYLKMKMSMDFSSLPSSTAYNLRCMVGFCTDTLQQPDPADVSSSIFVDQVLTQLGKSGLLGSHLDFNIKRKGIKILKDFRVKGDRNSSLTANVTEGQSDPPNPVASLSFEWPMGIKTWANPNAPGNQFFPTRSWIPFVAFYCPEFSGIDAATAPAYLLSSKLWFTDQ